MLEKFKQLDDGLILTNIQKHNLLFGNPIYKTKPSKLGNIIVILYIKDQAILNIGPNCKIFLIRHNAYNFISFRIYYFYVNEQFHFISNKYIVYIYRLFYISYFSYQSYIYLFDDTWITF